MAKVTLETHNTKIEHALPEGNATWQNAIVQCIIDAIKALNAAEQVDLLERLHKQLKEVGYE